MNIEDKMTERSERRGRPPASRAKQQNRGVLKYPPPDSNVYSNAFLTPPTYLFTFHVYPKQYMNKKQVARASESCDHEFNVALVKFSQNFRRNYRKIIALISPLETADFV